MMRRFLNDKSGTTFEGIALSVSIVAVAFVASADLLDYATKGRSNPSAARIPMMATNFGPSKTNLDMEPTGSLPKLISRSVLDPCTGQVR